MLDLRLAPPPLASVPDLARYDAVVIATSAGKDSQTALRHTVAECRRQAYPLSRVHVVHADLGRVEWPGVVELAREQAVHYGLNLTVVTRTGRQATRGGRCYAKGEAYGDLLDHVRRMGFWPRISTRFCTADHKRDRIIVEIGRLVRAMDLIDKPARVLNVVGLRGEESDDRARLPPLEKNLRGSSARREIMTWLPLHAWSESAVWRDVWASGVPWHWAYDMGMPRLSCSFCVFASRPALRTAAILRPELATEYGSVEVDIGHLFRVGLSIEHLAAEVRDLTPVELARRFGAEGIEGWRA